ncbi:hypothetical protein [Streptomyces sp. NBC_01180]|uniref:hypothetical protein n=1 Tax=Streptomyces sp. NBC_01180 TaxID=2903763 RepID=UPI00386C104A|nr:hypothetical protein OG708_19315 [Streptomyces sp. NBC_01180]
MSGTAPAVQRSAAPGMPVPHAMPEPNRAPAPEPNRAPAPGSSAAARPVVRPTRSGEPVVQRRAVSLPGSGGTAPLGSGAAAADVPAAGAATTPVVRPVQRSAGLSGPVPSVALPGGPSAPQSAQQSAAVPVPQALQRASVPGGPVTPVPLGPAAVSRAPDSVRQEGAPARHGVDGLGAGGVAQALTSLPVQRAAAPQSTQSTPSAPTAPAMPAPPAPLTARTTLPTPGAVPVPDAAGRQAATRVVGLGSASAGPASAALPVQRAPGGPPALVKPSVPAPPQLSAVNVTAHSTSGGSGNGGSGSGNGGGGAPPPPYTERPDSPPPYSAVPPNLNNGPRCDGSTEASGNRFDARELSDGQVDELTHRLMGPLTRLLRTELRMDRERIGRLRDPRR